MFNKKIIIIALIFVSLLTISSVSASEITNETSDLLSIDNDDVLLDVNDDESEALGSNPDGTFTDLANEIANATCELNLTKNYIYSDDDSNYKDGIIIDKSIKINGNGFTISGNNQAHAFNVTASDVILKDIYFVNCSSSSISNSIYDFSYIYGGAVTWYGANGVLEDCAFVNCSVSFNSSSYYEFSRFSGGAVYWGGVNGVLEDCAFVNCSVSYNSSSSYSNIYGGAVYWGGVNGVLEDCAFVNCSASSISNSSYYSCSSYGGAVHWSSADGVLRNCGFVNCLANSSSSYGGAVSFGGAVYWCGVNGVLEDCAFVNCSASSSSTSIGDSTSNYGGAVFWSYFDGVLDNCSFVNCSVSVSNGYYNYVGGGAVYWSDGNGTVYNCSFVNCSVSVCKGFQNYIYGGAVYWSGDDGVLINCNFVNCTADNGGAIYWRGDKGFIKECSFFKPSNSYDDYLITGENVTIIPGKTITNLIVNKTNYYSYGTCELTATLINWETGKCINGANVKFEINGVKYIVKTVNGQAKVNISDLAFGTYEATVSYSGNSKYRSSSETFIVVVNKISTSISLYYDAVTNELVATLINAETGKGIGNANVAITLNGVKYTLKTKQGVVRLSLGGADPNTFTATASYYGNAKYLKSTTTIRPVADKITTYIAAVYDKETDEIIVTLTNSEADKLITGANVAITLNGIKNTVKIQGYKATISTAGLAPDVYSVVSSYYGSTKYAKSSTTINIVKS